MQSQGGGLFYYYLIHLIFNLKKLFKEVKIRNLTKKTNNKHNFIDYLHANLLCGKKIPCEIEICNNSNNNIHQLRIVTKNNVIELINKSRNWTNKFMIKEIKNNKIKFKNKSNNERHHLTLKNMKELLNYKFTSQDKYIQNLSNIISSHKIIKKIALTK